MGKRSDYFTKHQYFGADEMAGKALQVTISSVEDVEFEKDNGKAIVKPVLSFRNEERKLVIGPMNYDRISDALGDETRGWVGHAVTLRGEKVLFRGKRVNSIVAEPVRQPAPAAEPELDDAIPYEP